MEELIEELKKLGKEIEYYYNHGSNPYMMEQMIIRRNELEDEIAQMKEDNEL